MQVIQEKYTLTYERYLNDMGCECDSFDLFDSETRVHRPFIAPMKVSNLTQDSSIGELGYTYTKKELTDLLAKEIKKLK